MQHEPLTANSKRTCTQQADQSAAQHNKSKPSPAQPSQGKQSRSSAKPSQAKHASKQYKTHAAKNAVNEIGLSFQLLPCRMRTYIMSRPSSQVDCLSLSEQLPAVLSSHFCFAQCQKKAGRNSRLRTGVILHTSRESRRRIKGPVKSLCKF